MAPRIPDRWTIYKPMGQKIEGTRFIAFKVPLREHISNTVEHDQRLDARILLESVPNLGLIIDLTNTKRYYDPNIFKNIGVEYAKLMIPGVETPPKALVRKFIELVKEYLQKNPDNDRLIGVHCTHGVNRTGYLICHYMISEMTIDPNEAITRFANARGHKIERVNYINALLRTNDTKSDNGNNLAESRKISSDSYDRYKSLETYERDRNYSRRSRIRYQSRSNLPEYSTTRSREDRYNRNFIYHRNSKRLPETDANVTNRRPALRTDYYRKATDRYRYIRNTDKI